MKIILSYSDYLNENYQEVDKIFFRKTLHPLEDLKRNWSCHQGGWFQTEEEAVNFYKNEDGHLVGLMPPKKDDSRDMWCGLPEDGLSGFVIRNEDDYEKYLDILVNEYRAKNSIAVFESSDYDLGNGSDGEDLFRGGTFLFFLDINSTYHDYLEEINKLKKA